MISTKEQAYKLIKLYEDQNYFNEDAIFKNAKYNALICVNQIKESWIMDGARKHNVSILHWWDKVKENIESMSILDI